MGLKKETDSASIEGPKVGLPFNTLAHIAGEASLPIDTLASAVGINRATMDRRKIAGKLTATESKRLFAISLIVAKATALFGGNATTAAKWLLTLSPALGDRTPLEMAASEKGSRDVEALIGRLKHGIFS